MIMVCGMSPIVSKRESNLAIILLFKFSTVRNPQEARNLTDEYGQKFKAMEPLKPSQKPQ
ncbi:hypothetical protein [Xanthomonas arboricola]|uniref:hypothetical protein n=1 Tax=Xanthomonas arboricola TaxID=56448 RepID=UPI002B2E940A|nr:hypothetical protein X12_003572 [Xanthomonas arboricola]